MQITLHRSGVLLVIAETKLDDLIIPFLLAPLVASPLAKHGGASVSSPKKVRMSWEPRVCLQRSPFTFCKAAPAVASVGNYIVTPR